MGAAAIPIMIGATVAATGVAAYGTVQAGQASKAQADYQSKVARNNQIISEFKAQEVRDLAATKEDLVRRETAQLKSRQRASSAARGVEVDTGSALDITSDTAALGELDASIIRDEGERRAAAFRNQAQSFENEQGLRRSQGRNASRAALLQTAGTIIGGVGQVSGQWYDFKRGT